MKTLDPGFIVGKSNAEVVKAVARKDLRWVRTRKLQKIILFRRH
jgi:hypothetical protein